MFGAFIIGDELLVGKREDKHLAFLIGALARRGLRLGWAHYLGDDPARLTEALARSLASSDVVFSFGGIGATPDDHTRQCAAAALQVPLMLHAEAEREIRARFAGQEVTPQRLQMGEFPKGAAIMRKSARRWRGCAAKSALQDSRTNEKAPVARGSFDYFFFLRAPVFTGALIAFALDRA